MLCHEKHLRGAMSYLSSSHSTTAEGESSSAHSKPQPSAPYPKCLHQPELFPVLLSVFGKPTASLASAHPYMENPPEKGRGRETQLQQQQQQQRWVGASCERSGASTTDESGRQGGREGGARDRNRADWCGMLQRFSRSEMRENGGAAVAGRDAGRR